MAKEIERKFLVHGTAWRDQSVGHTVYRQGYILNTPEKIVRVRVADTQAWLTIKKTETANLTERSEFEYKIPVADAHALIEQVCEPGMLEKTRYRVPHGNHVWEVDVFHGANDGLIVAEVELAAIDETISFPDWVGEEVSHDHRYINAALIKNPYSRWKS